jgi:hypothetical protein
MANNKLQIKRTTVAGRTPNTTNSGNSQYISTGELALNLADGKLYTSDGTNLINLTPTSSGGSVNTAAQYAFTNTLSFSNTITFTGSILANTVNATSYTTGATGAGTGGLVANTSTVYLGNTASNIYFTSAGFYAPDGNTSNPSYSFGSETGTGFWRVGGQNIGVNFVGTQKYSFDNIRFKTQTGRTDAANPPFAIENVSYGFYNPGSALGIVTNGSEAARFDLSGNFIPGANNRNLGNTSLIWNIYANNGFYSTITTANISANGTTGTAGQVLTSNGTIVYWATPSSGSGSSVTVSDTAPSSPASGDLWYYTGTSELFIYYNDGTSSQWVTTAATYVPSAFSTLSVSGNASFSSNVTISNTRISANGSTGTAGQVLTSSGTGANVYWSTPSSGITTGKSIAMAIVFGG